MHEAFLSETLTLAQQKDALILVEFVQLGQPRTISHFLNLVIEDGPGASFGCGAIQKVLHLLVVGSLRNFELQLFAALKLATHHNVYLVVV